jgi:hypothetical protein
MVQFETAGIPDEREKHNWYRYLAYPLTQVHIQTGSDAVFHRVCCSEALNGWL